MRHIFVVAVFCVGVCEAFLLKARTGGDGGRSERQQGFSSLKQVPGDDNILDQSPDLARELLPDGEWRIKQSVLNELRAEQSRKEELIRDMGTSQMAQKAFDPNTCRQDVYRMKFAFKRGDKLTPERMVDCLSQLGCLRLTATDLSGADPHFFDFDGQAAVAFPPDWNHVSISVTFRTSTPPNLLLQCITRQLRLWESGEKFKCEVSFIEKADPKLSVVPGLYPLTVGNVTYTYPDDTSGDAKEEGGPLSYPPFTWKQGARIKLEGGVGQGSGHSETTQMASEWVQRRTSEAALEGRGKVQVLDWGAGTGILGLTALASGARYATCIEKDPDAALAIIRNAKSNRYSSPGQLDVLVPTSMGEDNFDDISRANSLLDHEATVSSAFEHVRLGYNGNLESIERMSAVTMVPFQLVVANVNIWNHLRMPAILQQLTMAEGWLGITGIKKEDAERVMNHHRMQFEQLKIVDERDGWVMIEGRRKGRRKATLLAGDADFDYRKRDPFLRSI
uniref:ETFB lysine methyltransferase n=1 Tax=Chromera velia CCMP2878 TaxID=1169474 RepID=A0A0G4EYE3_9ALVE|mmetsp:Transcript_13555/g.26898  ORF Transcript_13555/g.26898 Transcript_13555/m.26898 type:complete len:506 (+) Transcript_13555:216-1733(+)|eukprot:Cvel_14282.t1-p1 / transcript=Cvel_14282.t1 / gene=Cvel_14282 / organism=Chromera_velia_CCMP2878 / gene_product=hypothetical protein / transcript_product=hypothetical protein / location=Cvel_scaffold1008:32775-38972(-) / protein_length=505 / sequence_SO=supercontig / SO=protein_coding / is_pseudo=false